MNYSVKVCDMCQTCVYTGEYEIRDNEIICVMCIREEEEQQEENEIPHR
jgi:hypothetical protein